MPTTRTLAEQRDRARRVKATRAAERARAAQKDQLGFDFGPPRRAPAVAKAAVPATLAPSAVPVGPTALPAPVPAAAPVVALRRTAPTRDREDGQSLDALLTRTWDGLLAHGSVVCPVCRGAMTPRYAAGPRPVGGRCRDCSATLA